MSPFLTLDSLHFAVPNRPEPLVNGINLAVAEHDFVVILGSNGSGKSTLIKLINQMYRQQRGTIELNGKPIKDLSARERAQTIVTLTQSTQDSLFLDLTVFENAELWQMRTQSVFRSGSKARQLAELKEYLHDFNPKLAANLESRVHQLSGGEQQTLILALALRNPPKLLLLDEHTSALDPKTANRMMAKTFEEIHKRGITCLMTTHHLDFAVHYGNRLLAIREGEIVFEAADEAKTALGRDQLLDYCYV